MTPRDKAIERLVKDGWPRLHAIGFADAIEIMGQPEPDEVRREALRLLDEIQEKMAGVTEAEVDAALNETRNSGLPEWPAPEPEGKTALDVPRVQGEMPHSSEHIRMGLCEEHDVYNCSRHWQPAPEPEEPLDTRVCRALGKHDNSQMYDDRICYGPSDDPWQNRCFPWSTSDLGAGAMLAWLQKQGKRPTLQVRSEGNWHVVNLGFFARFNGDTPQAALANAVAAVGERDA